MGVTNSNKVADASAICCGDTFKMTLALTAAPDIVENPTDIVLVLDRSGSMSGAPLADMKVGAKTFIDIISESTGGAGSGEIGSGSRMGIVSFAANASVDAQLVTSVADLKAAVDGISAGGGTNHGDAFQKAQGFFLIQSDVRDSRHPAKTHIGVKHFPQIIAFAVFIKHLPVSSAQGAAGFPHFKVVEVQELPE